VENHLLLKIPYTFL